MGTLDSKLIVDPGRELDTGEIIRILESFRVEARDEVRLENSTEDHLGDRQWRHIAQSKNRLPVRSKFLLLVLKIVKANDVGRLRLTSKHISWRGLYNRDKGVSASELAVKRKDVTIMTAGTDDTFLHDLDEDVKNRLTWVLFINPTVSRPSDKKKADAPSAAFPTSHRLKLYSR